MKIAILTKQQFWNSPIGSATILRGRYRILKKKFDIDVLYISKVNIILPVKGFSLKIDKINNKTQNQFYDFIIKQKYKAIYCDYNLFWPLVCHLPKEIKKVLELHDVLHLRTDSFNRYGYTAPYTAEKKTEISQLKKYDKVISLSYNETKYLKNNDLKNIITIPPTTEKIIKSLNPILFKCGIIGSRAEPNVDGIKYFFNSYKASEKIIVAGLIFEEIEKKHRYKFENMGIIKSLEKFFNQISVNLVPVRFGAGLKVKVFDSLVNSKAIFSTSHGIEGFPKGIKDISIIQDKPNQWSENNFKESSNINQNKIFEYAKSHFEDSCYVNELENAFN